MTLTRFRPIFGSRRAQAVIELAVFGAIVLYLIGLIISQSTSTAYQQESQLQAMRIALLSSYQSALAGQSRRNSASFLILEDRLASGSGRYGVSDRQPFLAMGSGTMSMHLFKPVDWEDIANQSEVPITDVRINGQIFNMKVARAARYRIRFQKQYTTDNNGTPTVDLNRSYVTIHMMHSCTVNYCNPDNTCETLLEISSSAKPAAPAMDPDRDARRLKLEWTLSLGGALGDMGGYPPAYVMVVKNDDANFKLPTHCPNDPSITSEDITNLRRFDLNRDGEFPDICCPNPLAYILWEWDWKSLSSAASEIDTENGVYPNYDVDGDLTEETVYALSQWAETACGAGTVIGYDISVLDWDRGDVNSAANERDYPKSDTPGLHDDMRIYTSQLGGTYMKVEEQKNATQTLGRSTSTVKKNQEDMIERKYVLNDRMIGGGSLCDADTSLPLQAGVQACCASVGCCGQGARADVTCVEYPAGGVKKLMIRSRIPDKRGRLWATDVTP